MLAGIFIAVAAIIYIRCDNPIIGAILFSVGLLACLIFKAPLCTGLANEPWKRLKHNPFECRVPKWQSFCSSMSNWLLLYVANCWFALIIGVWARLCIDVDRAVDVVQAKVSHPWYWILFMGFLCGILIQCAVNAYKRRVEYWPFVILCVTAFLMLGAEHCVADAAFIGMCAGRDCCSLDFGLGCAKLVGVAGLGNLLAGTLFCNE